MENSFSLDLSFLFLNFLDLVSFEYGEPEALKNESTPFSISCTGSPLPKELLFVQTGDYPSIIWEIFWAFNLEDNLYPNSCGQTFRFKRASFHQKNSLKLYQTYLQQSFNSETNQWLEIFQ